MKIKSIFTLRAGATLPPDIFNAVSDMCFWVKVAGACPLNALADDAKRAARKIFLNILLRSLHRRIMVSASKILIQMFVRKFGQNFCNHLTVARYKHT